MPFLSELYTYSVRRNCGDLKSWYFWQPAYFKESRDVMTYWTNISFVISFPLLFKEMVENKLALWLWISWNCFYILWSATTVTKWLNKNNESSQCRWPRGDHLMLMAMSLSKQRCFKFWKCNNEALHNSTLSMSVAQLLLWLGSRMRGCGTCGLVLRSSKYSFLFSVLAGCTVHLSSCPVGKRSFFSPHEANWQESDVINHLHLTSRLKKTWSCVSTFIRIFDPVLR